jgi:hypothetical protein
MFAGTVLEDDRTFRYLKFKRDYHSFGYCSSGDDHDQKENEI